MPAADTIQARIQVQYIRNDVLVAFPGPRRAVEMRPGHIKQGMVEGSPRHGFVMMDLNREGAAILELVLAGARYETLWNA